MQTLQDAFTEEATRTGQPKLQLTAATAAGITTIEASYDLHALARYGLFLVAFMHLNQHLNLPGRWTFLI
jgi:hypothetical protein